jgi:CBS domain containing-hemolysin-like protein
MLLNLLIYINKRKLNKMITSGYNYEEILKQSQMLDNLINIYMRNWVRWKGWKNYLMSLLILDSLSIFLVHFYINICLHKKVPKSLKKKYLYIVVLVNRYVINYR